MKKKFLIVLISVFCLSISGVTIAVNAEDTYVPRTVTLEMTNPSTWTWAATTSAKVPEGYTGTSYATGADGGLTPEFTAVDLSGFYAANLVFQAWFYSDAEFKLNDDCSIFDSDEHYYGNLFGTLASGWHHVQIPVPAAANGSAVKSFLFMTKTSQVLMYGACFTDDTTDPSLKVLESVPDNYTPKTTALTMADSSTWVWPSGTTAIVPEGYEGISYVTSFEPGITPKFTSVDLSSFKAENLVFQAWFYSTAEFKLDDNCSIFDSDEHRLGNLFGTLASGWHHVQIPIPSEANGNAFQFFLFITKTSNVLMYGAQFTDDVTNASLKILEFKAVNYEAKTVMLEMENPSTWQWSSAESSLVPGGFTGVSYMANAQGGITPKFKPVDLSSFFTPNLVFQAWFYSPTGISLGNNCSIFDNTGEHYFGHLFNTIESGWHKIQIPVTVASGNAYQFYFFLLNNVDVYLYGACFTDNAADTSIKILESQEIPTGISFAADALSLDNVNTSVDLPAISYEPVSAIGNIEYSSDSESVAEIKDGKIVAKGNGTAIITAKLQINKNITDTLTVTVTGFPTVTTITVTNGTAIELKIGVTETHNIEVSVLEEGASYDLRYSSSDLTVAIVNSSGKITAVSKGSVIITIKDYNTNVSTTITVNVTEEPEVTQEPEPDKTSSCGCGAIGFYGNGGGGYILLISGVLLFFLYKRYSVSKFNR